MGAKATTRPRGERNIISFVAEGGALVEKYGVMRGTADYQAKVPTGADVLVLGIVDEGGGAAAVGDPVAVVQGGETIAISGQASLGTNVPVSIDADGKVVSAAAGDHNVVGITRSSADAEDDEVLVFVNIQPKRS